MLVASHGVPIAINVGDATNVTSMALLLENVAAIGVRRALLILREFERMARESVEGQAIELWIRRIGPPRRHMVGAALFGKM
jgi:geranylgeranyl diphosphate synthase type II